MAKRQIKEVPVVETEEAKAEAEDKVQTEAEAPAVEAEAPPVKPEPLTANEKAELVELDRRSRMGRKIDQPTPREMERLGLLRVRSKIEVVG